MDNTKNRGAVISALSDAENPAPSLHEALNRARLHRYASAEQTHSQPRRAEKVRCMDVCEKTGIRSQPHHGCGRLSRGRGMGVMTKSLPKPLMLDGEPHYTARQITGMRLPGMPGTESGVIRVAKRRRWGPRHHPSGQGGGKVYPLKALPDKAQAKIRRRARPKPTQPAPASSASTQKKTNDKKRLFLALGLDQRAMVDAKSEAVVLWRQYRRNLPREISIPDARKAFCTLAGHAGAEERVRRALPSFAAHSLCRWDKALARGGLNALVDQRGQAQAGRGILGTDTQMRDLVLGMLATYPRANATLLAQGLAVRFPSCRHRLPGVRTIQRWTKKWKEGNKVLWSYLRDPDAPQGRHALSADFSEDVSREEGRES